MTMNLPLAAWLLAMATFSLGTAIPFLYRRFSYDGIAIRPLDVRAIVPDRYNPNQFIIFGTLIRIANVSDRSIMIEDIQVDDLKLEKHNYRLDSAILADVTESRTAHIPLWPSDTSHVLPLILKQDTVSVFVLELSFTFGPGTPVEASNEIADAIIDNEDFPLILRLNGVYRRQHVNFRRRQPVFGYNIFIGVDPEPEE
ncbi:hypothetical protein ABZZ74_49810 [Streptomyces sp. NPDC006476]|uniref:hypothetical protein n=1 Tax=Streptomyces sp. NPDC006476 TaxID=3157175 RepID=UPI0033AF3A69